MKEYRLTIQAAGNNEGEAIERAVVMLNAGANFDEITYLYDAESILPENTES